MDKFKVGDVVCATHEDGTVITAPVRMDGRGWKYLGSSGRILDGMISDPCVSVSLVERAQPELPTDEGIYFPRKTFQPGTRIVKLQNGEWCHPDGLPLDDEDHEWLWLAFKRGDLTKFEPVADTARKVIAAALDYIREISPGRTVDEVGAALRKEFGVDL